MSKDAEAAASTGGPETRDKGGSAAWALTWVGERAWIQTRGRPFLFHLEGKECPSLFLAQVSSMGTGIVGNVQAGPSVWRMSQLAAP